MEEGYRIHSIDSLRAIAMLLGVLLHALTLYLEPIDGSGLRLWAGALLTWITIWRMPLFMLLAGFFTCLSLAKRTTSSYAINRVVRLGAPLIILWLAIPAVDESASQIFKWPEFISWLTINQPFTLRLDHLWFLYYLLIFYAIILSLRAINPRTFELITNFKLNFLTISFIWLPLITLSAPWARPLGGIFSEIPTTFGELKIGSMIFMAAFFLIGMQLFNNQLLLQRLQAVRFWLTAVIICSVLPIGLMAWGIMKDPQFVFSGRLEMWMVNSLSTFASVFMILGLLGVSCRFVLGGGPILSWLVKLSYPTYVFHIVFVYPIGGILLLSGWNAALVVLFSCLSGLVGSVVIYYAFIWHSPLDWVFNGYKNSKFKVSSSVMKKITKHL